MDPEDLRVYFTAILTSGGGRLSERQFISDYRSLVGGFIPYDKLGHKTLRSLVESLGGFYYTRDIHGDVINAGYDEKTAHISKLIAGQKKKPGAGKSKKRSFSYSRPKLPHRLTQLRRPTPTYSYSSYTSVRPSPPKPRYGNPPVVPQRQPLGNPPIVPQRQPLGNPPIVPQRQPLGNPPIVPQRRPLGNPPIVPQRQPLGNPPIVRQPLGNPPIISQRQSQSSAQQRLDVTLPERPPLKKLTSVQDRLTREARNGPSLDVKEAQAKVLSVNSSDAQKTPNPEPKEPSLKEPAELADASYIDIQWLRGKVHSNGKLEKEVKKQTEPDSCPLPTVQPSLVQQLSPVPPMSLSVQPPIQPSAPQPAKSPNRIHPSEQMVVFKSHVEELATLVAELALGEAEYKYIERCPSRGKPVYTSKLKVGNGVYTSYPDEKASREEAQECVSKLAVEDLQKKHTYKHVRCPVKDKSLGLRKFEEVKDRIYSIIENKPNGMFDEAIAQEYEKEHHGALPLGWLQELENSSLFAIDKFLSNRTIIYPVPKTPITPTPITPTTPTPITPTTPTPITPTTPTPITPTLPPTVFQSIGLVNISYEKSYQDINANNVVAGNRGGTRKLPQLILPNEQTWDVFVTSASVNEVWVRLIGKEYDDLYNDVINDLEMNMLSSEGQMASNPEVGEYFACKFDNCWLRVQLNDINKETEEAEVFLIDNGDTDKIHLTELRVLEDKYLDLPAQAIKCRLSYLDISYEEAQTYLLNNVIGNTFVAEILQPPTEGSCAAVVLHNTEVSGEPINLNYCILDEISKNLSTPQLPQPFGNLKITHIDKETPPFVQIKSRDLSLLETILEDVSKLDLVEQHGVNAHPKLNQVDARNRHMFLARSRRCPKTWRRGVITNTDNARNPVVLFIDHGYSENVMWSSIFDIAKIIPPLMKFPIQAIQVNLYNLNPSQIVPGIVKRIKELAPSDQFVFGKRRGDSGAGDQFPAVEFFKRVQPDNIMCSINSDLLFNYEEYCRCPDEATNGKPEEHINAHPKGSSGSTDPLPSYSLPLDSDFFDVFVCMSSNPFNFVVQPVKELQASFNNMMKDVQDYYEAQHSIMPQPSVDDLQENCTFAAKHPDDDTWYRVAIVAVINEAMVSVRYCDYGDLGLVAVDRLRYLEPRFRHIPALAIRAKLHGVKPINIDWSVDECVRFNELVESKALVSKVLERNAEAGLNSWRISLQLIDTGDANNDIDLAKLLVNEGKAEWVVE